MAIIFLLMAGLGSDDWETREYYSQLCNNPVFAILAPSDHPDPEVRNRVHKIKATQLWWYYNFEKYLRIRHFGVWVHLYIVKGTKYTDDELFQFFRDDVQSREKFFKLHASKHQYMMFSFPIRPEDIQSFKDHLKTIRAK